MNRYSTGDNPHVFITDQGDLWELSEINHCWYKHLADSCSWQYSVSIDKSTTVFFVFCFFFFHFWSDVHIQLAELILKSCNVVLIFDLVDEILR